MTDEDLENRLREVLATRALDVSATAARSRPAAFNSLAPQAHHRCSEHTAEQAPPKPPRGKVRVLVAAAILVVAGSASFVAVRENRAQPLVAGNEPGEPQPEVSRTDATVEPRPQTAAQVTDVGAGWGTVVRLRNQFPAGFVLADAPPLFSVEGSPKQVVDAYFDERFGDRGGLGLSSDFEAIVDEQFALFRWWWGNGEGRIGEAQNAEVLEEGLAGWIYARLLDDQWRVIAATTDAVDLSGVGAMDGRIAGIVRSSDANALSVDVFHLDDGQPASESPEGRFGVPGAADNQLFIDVATGGRQVALRVRLVGGSFLSITEMVMPGSGEATAAKAERVASEQLVPSTEQAEGVADPAWPLPRLVIDPAKVGLEAVSKGQFDNSANPDDTREREHIQSFREASDSLGGPMIFVVSDQDGSDFLRSGQTQGLESFVVDGYEFYPMASGGNPQMLIGSGPGESSVVVVGVGMTRARVVEFAERMRAPLPGTVAWRVPDPGPVLVPVFADFRRPTDSPTAGLSQFASWEIGGDQALLVVAGGGESEFEYQLYDAAKRAWGSVSISFEVVEGRSAVLISSSLVQAAVWRENDQATALLIGGPTDGAGSSTAFSIRDLLGTITEVSEAEWLALGRSIEANDGEPPAVTAPPGS